LGQPVRRANPTELIVIRTADKPLKQPLRDSITAASQLRLAVAPPLVFPDGSRTASGLRRESARGQVAPRLLTRIQAAIYCGISVPTLSVHCPVRPISLGPGKRLERYDIHSLDRWIDTLSGVAESSGKDWLAALEPAHGNRSRERG
jgi:hypothetical protein